MLDLEPLGCKAPFGDCEDEDDDRAYERYCALDSLDRVDLALRFAERAALLERVAFLHCDLNPPNLQLNLTSRDVQVIDFDAGMVLVRGDERRLTAGKPDDCMPPEVKVPGRSRPALERYTAHAERWSIGSLMGLFLTGEHPGFFLRMFGARTVDAYARSAHTWPDIDIGGPLFRAAPAWRTTTPAGDPS